MATVAERLEPEAVASLVDVDTNKLALLSIAISLKRLADVCTIPDDPNNI